MRHPEELWKERMAILAALNERGITDEKSVIRETGWTCHVAIETKRRLHVLMMTDEERDEYLRLLNPWGRERPVQHRICERCEQPIGTYDLMHNNGRLTLFRGVMCCYDCLMEWIDLPPGRKIHNVSGTTKAKRMSRILSKS